MNKESDLKPLQYDSKYSSCCTVARWWLQFIGSVDTLADLKEDLGSRTLIGTFIMKQNPN